MHYEPNARVVALNGAIYIVDASEMFTAEYQLADKFRGLAGPDVKIHSRMPGKYSLRTKGGPDDFPEIDDWHETPPTRGGTASAAAMWLLGEGHKKVILAGCPFDWEAGYADGGRITKTQPWRDKALTKMHRAGMLEDFKKGLLRGVYSMSGWTKTLLGAPEWLQTSTFVREH